MVKMNKCCKKDKIIIDHGDLLEDICFNCIDGCKVCTKKLYPHTYCRSNVCNDCCSKVVYTFLDKTFSLRDDVSCVSCFCIPKYDNYICMVSESELDWIEQKMYLCQSCISFISKRTCNCEWMKSHCNKCKFIKNLNEPSYINE
jgi:hypothetical protein